MTGGMNLLSAVFCSDSVDMMKESEEKTGKIKWTIIHFKS
jgi:hypothetical protein